jgi:CRP-like cAMP-binding protein
MAFKGNKIQLLKNVSLFSACTNRELSKIASLADEVEVPAGAVLTQEGKPGREFFAIADGNATCRIRGKKIAQYGPGDFFGEMALLDQAPRVATITADSSMKLLVLDARSFSSLLDQAPSVSRKILRGMAQRLRQLEKAPTL